MRTSLIIKDGHFYKNGEIVPPVIGDIEQIKVLREYEDRQEVIESGILASPRVDSDGDEDATFKCKCGKGCSIGFDSDMVTEWEYTVCSKCTQSYYLTQEGLKYYAIPYNVEDV